jgi:CheY-like chemotaxis protein
MSPKRILVVDDEPAVTRALKLNLEMTGHYAVRMENSGVKALAAAQEFRPDLILLDVMMPEVDGGDVAAQIGNDPGLHNVPIIYLTALASHQDSGAREAGSDKRTVLAKPVDLGQLLACLQEHLPA